MTSTSEKLTQARDSLKHKLFERVEQLDEFVKQKHRRTKVSKLFDECNDLHHQIAEKTAKLLESEDEGVCKEATEVSTVINNFCREIFEKTQKYIREPTPKSDCSKVSTKCSSMRAQIELKMREEEIERQAEAQKKLLEAELHLKALRIEENKRKKIQAAKDKAWLSELDKNSEIGSVDLENEETENFTEKWVTKHAKAASADAIQLNTKISGVIVQPQPEQLTSASTAAVTNNFENFQNAVEPSIMPINVTTFPQPISETFQPPIQSVAFQPIPPVSTNRIFAKPPNFQPNLASGAGLAPPLVSSSTAPNFATPVNPTLTLLENFLEKQMHHESLPKFELDIFEGDPVKWPEWQGLFLATCCNASVSLDMRMRYLKLFTSGKARATIEGYGFSGVHFDQAFAALKRRFGAPHLIVGAQIEKISKYPQVKMHNSESIIEFSQVVNSFVSVLSAENFFNDLQSTSNLSLLVSKLPINLREQWFAVVERSTGPVNLLTFRDWLQQKASVHERLALTNSSVVAKPEKFEKVKKHTSFSSNVSRKDHTVSKTSESCPFCQQSHRIWKCPSFAAKTVKQRTQFVREKQLCFSCLQNGHMARDCKKRLKCPKSGCNKAHNVLLHSDEQTTSTESKLGSGEGVAACTISRARKGALQVIEVGLKSGSATTKAWALCDTGSSNSWISEVLRSELCLSGSNEVVSVRGVTGSFEGSTRCVDLELFSLEDESFVPLKFSALVRPGLSLGTEKLNLKDVKKACPHLRVVVADVIDFSKISVILGQDVYSAICPLGYKKAENHSPWAVQLPLGWVMSGQLPNCKSLKDSICFASNEEMFCCDNEKLSAQMSKWWASESYASNIDVDPRSLSDKNALKILEKSCKFNGERYCVGLLWGNSQTSLPNNFALAKSHFLSLEKRLDRNPDLKHRYAESIRIDVEKGYVRKISAEELAEGEKDPQWYLPHHPVVNPNKPEKVRRVCNAASRFCRISLNEALVPGPDLLSDLIGIFLRFRLFLVAITADIEAMFMQIEVPEKEQNFLRFLWREEVNENLEVYQYTRHIFGATSSPTVANFCVQQCARDNRLQFPLAFEAVFDSFYVDDFLKSFVCSENAASVTLQVKQMLDQCGFNLTKFMTNDFETFQQMSKVVPFEKSSFDQLTETSVLGIQWDPKSDSLSVCRGLTKLSTEVITQRKILSAVSGIFDPMGFISPFTIRGRLILKDLWCIKGQNWDAPVPDEIREAFIEWDSEKVEVSSISIDRCIFRGSSVTNAQLHVFVDASQSAMCAVIYLRAKCDEVLQVSFLVGKCRVAPIRSTTIPKLELQAALIGLRLATSIRKFLPLTLNETFFWSDSSTVLQWVASSHKRLPVFVANRVAEILDHSRVDEWNFVPGLQNPADIGTRGVKVIELKQSEWFTGPSFLNLDRDQWPKKPEFERLPETETTVCATVLVEVNQEKDVFTQLFVKFSKFEKLKRVMAYVLRVRTFLKQRRENSKSFEFPRNLTAEELRESELVIWRLVQREAFDKDYVALEKGNNVLDRSSIAPLVPFMCDGLIRARGRVRRASHLTFEQKHPLILSSQHPVVKLFLNKVHVDNFHEGIEFLRSIVQQRYWVVGLRSELRRIKLNCLLCKKRSPSFVEPQMADLPNERLGFNQPPFAFTGLDFFGPFEVKVLRSTQKRWCCLFTCQTTRAIHLEICHSLSTDSCLLAIQRFIARRGLPKTLTSDNGTNFVGASKELKNFASLLSQCDEIPAHLNERACQWKFNPPASPHFGGVWERLVRSCKKAMFAVLNGRRLTEETLVTTLCLVEQLLNSRPLTAVSSDMSDLEALTPNHFLLGRSTVFLPVGLIQATDHCHRRVFRQAQCYTELIWRRWLNEYVPQLQTRSKWFSDSSVPINVDSLVWIVESSSPKGQYPLGRVLKLNLADDGIARSATIKTSNGVYTRPLVKLVPLP